MWLNFYMILFGFNNYMDITMQACFGFWIKSEAIINLTQDGSHLENKISKLHLVEEKCIFAKRDVKMSSTSRAGVSTEHTSRSTRKSVLEYNVFSIFMFIILAKISTRPSPVYEMVAILHSPWFSNVYKAYDNA